MAVQHTIRPIESQPGIQRDGTKFASDNYIDGQWVRWFEGKARKIGGYQLLLPGTPDIIRTLSTTPRPTTVDTYIGRAPSAGPSGPAVSVTSIDNTNIASPENDRTPADYSMIPISYNPNNVWKFDFLLTPSLSDIAVFAHVAPNLNNIANTTEGPIYYGNIANALPLTQFPTPQSVSGGICVTPPFLFKYGNDGKVEWSDIDDPLTFSSNNKATIASTKIVQGLSTRGGGVPGVLFWSLNSLVRGTFVDGGTAPTVIFGFDTVSDSVSILSPKSVVVFNQFYYWVGKKQFYMYNGVVQNLQNTMSTEYFFGHLNNDQAEKVYGVANYLYGEIWWFYPKDNSVECNAVIIYNVNSNTWYDSAIARSAGVADLDYYFPLFADASPLPVPGHPLLKTYGLWRHESGVDQVIDTTITAIPSFYETAMMRFYENSPDTMYRIRRIEPDFVQFGDMNIIVKTRGFARSNVINSQTFNFNPTTPKIDTKEQGRFISFRVESNTLGGFYMAGDTLATVSQGDTRPLS